jgi:hypothetical protein
MSRQYWQTRSEGAATELYLKPILEDILGEALEKQEETARLDFYARVEKGWHEIKGRDSFYRSDDRYAEKGWWVGYPKVLAARQKQEPVTFWYYFSSDHTLWKLPFQDELFSQFTPFLNAQGQLTLCIPKKFWTQVKLPAKKTSLCSE